MKTLLKTVCALLLLVPALIVAASLPGCKKSGATGSAVTGNVVFKGEPLPGGVIKFHSKDPTKKIPFTGNINGDGTFSFPDVPVLGEVIVTVDNSSLERQGEVNVVDPNEAMKKGAGEGGGQGVDPKAAKDTMKKEGAQGAIPMPKMKEGIAGKYVRGVPKKYADPTTSDLTWNLPGGAQNKTFVLQEK